MLLQKDLERLYSYLILNHDLIKEGFLNANNLDSDSPQIFWKDCNVYINSHLPSNLCYFKNVFGILTTLFNYNRLNLAEFVDLKEKGSHLSKIELVDIYFSEYHNVDEECIGVFVGVDILPSYLRVLFELIYVLSVDCKLYVYFNYSDNLKDSVFIGQNIIGQMMYYKSDFKKWFKKYNHCSKSYSLEEVLKIFKEPITSEILMKEFPLVEFSEKNENIDDVLSNWFYEPDPFDFD